MRGRPAKRRKTKSRKKSRTKAAKSARGRTSKSKKTTKSRKASKATATRKASSKQAAPVRKKTSKKLTRSKAPGALQSGAVLGGGNYTASRESRGRQTEFVRRNTGKIPQTGEQAAAALGGDEAIKREEAEDSTRAHSHSPGEER